MALSSNYSTLSEKSQVRLFNTASRKLETFRPIDPEDVKIYTCGPTVYDYAHIGNLTSYVYWDLLVRTLILNGYKVNRVLNLTDVGHLASDADDGEDKLEKGAKREGKSVFDIAKFYGDYFIAKMDDLNLVKPTKICPATNYIEQGKALVQNLINQGLTYGTSDGIYFDTSKFTKYPDFARLDLDHLKAGARVDFNSEKRNASDFAVWKFIGENEDHAMRWDFLGRPGYPGWHLECSTIIHEELGEPIDIHTGGIDHIPVHHSNEIAQSESAFDHALSHYWLHCNFIRIDGEKMSKSLGNIYTLEQIKEQGFSPLDFKLWVLQGHYQSERNFTFADLAAAKARRFKWLNQIALALQTTIEDTNAFPAILEKVANNLNSPEALSAIDNTELSLDDWQKVDELFGLNLIETVKASQPDEAILAMIDNRQEAKKAKDYAAADALRTQIEASGYTVKDTTEGSFWQLASN